MTSKMMSTIFDPGPGSQVLTSSRIDDVHDIEDQSTEVVIWQAMRVCPVAVVDCRLSNREQWGLGRDAPWITSCTC